MKTGDSIKESDYVADAEVVLRAIYQRRAVRSYTDEPVTRDDVEALLDAAVHAPSATNAQPWAFAVIQDPGLLARYAREGKEFFLSRVTHPSVVTSDLPDLDRLRQWVATEDFELFHHAPTVVVICARTTGGVPDCYLAAENLMLSAWALGLGTCPIGLATPFFNRPEVKSELNVAPDWTAALPIAVGWPACDTPPTERRPVVVTIWK